MKIEASSRLLAEREVVKASNDHLFLNNTVIGHYFITKPETYTKEEFLKDIWDGDKNVTKIMKSVPDKFSFYYYWLEELALLPKFRGRGLGSQCLSAIVSTVKHPACLGLQPGELSKNVPISSLLRFYKANGFNVFEADGEWRALTFIRK